MKIIEKKDNKIVFEAEIEESLANAIRRYLGQIPIMAIDEVEILKNDSPLYDEMLAHRIGLIPLKIDKTINEKTTAKFKLIAKKEGAVYSKELIGEGEVVYDNAPITFLKKGQELEVNAIAKVGKSAEHSKFSPGLIFYRNIVNIEIDKDCPREVIDICPKKILVLENEKIIVKDNHKCDMCEVCIELCKKQKKGSIKITPTNNLKITLESFGQLDVKEIFKKAIDALKKDLASISKKISK